jgi:predicted kinase
MNSPIDPSTNSPRHSKETKFVFMAGRIASGKTTLAKKIASESNAILFSIDEWVGNIGRPTNFEEYTRYFLPCRVLIGELARELLQKGVSVVLDFGGNTDNERTWAKSIYHELDCSRELYFLDVPADICANRLKKRNAKNPDKAIRKESLLEAEKAGVKNYFIPPVPEDGFNVITVKND